MTLSWDEQIPMQLSSRSTDLPGHKPPGLRTAAIVEKHVEWRCRPGPECPPATDLSPSAAIRHTPPPSNAALGRRSCHRLLMRSSVVNPVRLLPVSARNLIRP